MHIQTAEANARKQVDYKRILFVPNAFNVTNPKTVVSGEAGRR